MTTDQDTPHSAESGEKLRRTEEFRTWFVLTFVMVPVLAVLAVSGYGFIVWMYQLIAGPPSV